MKSILQQAFDQNAPIISKRVKGNICPWLTNDLKDLMNRRDKMLRKARNSRRDCDWKEYKKLKNTCNNKVREAKNNHHKNLLLENRNDPRKFWHHIKEVFPSKHTKATSSAPFIDDSDNTPLSKANTFCKYFSTIASFLENESISVVKLRME